MIHLASWFFAPAAAAAAVAFADPGSAAMRHSQVLFTVILAARIVAALRPTTTRRDWSAKASPQT
jgi:hypothetical protein